MAVPPKKEASIQGVEVPIKWNVSENIITRFACHMVVQLLENEFKVSFFEINPEIRLQEQPKEVQANCVGSVIINANKLPSFIAVLQQQYDVYAKLKSENIINTIPTE